jgi:cytochrome c556
MKSSLLATVCAVLLAGAFSINAHAQAKPETLVKQRQAAMALQGKYFYGQLRPMAQGKMPYDAAAVARAAGFLEALSKMPWDGFAASTKGVKSGALPAVYNDAAKFKAASDQYEAETTKLAALTKSGNEAAVKEQILAINKSCNSCHESFRERE